MELEAFSFFMRRKEKEITDFNQIESIIKKAKVCRLGLSLNDIPYVFPMSFGYEDNIFYFHCASSGKKLDIIKENKNACIEIEEGVEIMQSDDACNWSVKYKSIIGSGKIEIMESLEEKQKAMDILMAQYSEDHFNIPTQAIEKTTMFKLVTDKITGKYSDN